MFGLRNKKDNFQIRTLIWRPVKEVENEKCMGFRIIPEFRILRLTESQPQNSGLGIS